MKRLAILTVAFLLSSYSLLAQKSNGTSSFNPANRPKNLSDSALLDLVQKQTFRYFWDFAHPVSGMARERSNVVFNYGLEAVTVEGTGFGIMAIIVACEHAWITREEAVTRLLKIVSFLGKADRYRGAFPHFLNGETGKTIVFSAPYSSKDDGADLVETSFLIQGLLCVRQYFSRDNQKEAELRKRITWIWNDIEWNWFTRGGLNVLYWHWSPNNEWSVNNDIR